MKGKKIVSTLLVLLLLASLPVSALAAEWDIGNGDITVNAGSGGQTGGSSSSGGTSQPSGGEAEPLYRTARPSLREPLRKTTSPSTRRRIRPQASPSPAQTST